MDILDKEYSKKFDELRKNRVEVSYHKYGPAKINFGDKLVNALDSANMCIEKYRATGNTEYLCDAANLSLAACLSCSSCCPCIALSCASSSLYLNCFACISRSDE